MAPARQAPTQAGAANPAEFAAHAPRVVADMVRWLERAVIGLQLCPFAKAVHVKQQIRYVVSQATQAEQIWPQLEEAVQQLAATDPEQTQTTLLILPWVLADFWAYNQFLNEANRWLRRHGYADDFQIASFHPQFQFGDAADDDVSHCTNRAPYPCLHLLRESSLDSAVASFPEAETIYLQNIDTMRQLGWSGWAELAVGATLASGPTR